MRSGTQHREEDRLVWLFFDHFHQRSKEAFCTFCGETDEDDPVDVVIVQQGLHDRGGGFFKAVAVHVRIDIDRIHPFSPGGDDLRQPLIGLFGKAGHGETFFHGGIYTHDGLGSAVGNVGQVVAFGQRGPLKTDEGGHEFLRLSDRQNACLVQSPSQNPVFHGQTGRV